MTQRESDPAPGDRPAGTGPGADVRASPGPHRGRFDRVRHPDGSVEIRLPHREIVLRHRYELASIANDVLIAAWFTVGSILFFNEDTARAGTWMFLIGSIQLGVRPVIRFSRLVHIRRRGSGLDTSTDY